jgi:hypothetical protein
MAGCFGTPAASIGTPGSSFSVVWPDKSAGKPTIPRQEITESREAVPPTAKDSLQLIAKDEAPAPPALLDASLFQRPPPNLALL